MVYPIALVPVLAFSLNSPLPFLPYLNLIYREQAYISEPFFKKTNLGEFSQFSILLFLVIVLFWSYSSLNILSFLETAGESCISGLVTSLENGISISLFSPERLSLTCITAACASHAALAYWQPTAIPGVFPLLFSNWQQCFLFIKKY